MRRRSLLLGLLCGALLWAGLAEFGWQVGGDDTATHAQLTPATSRWYCTHTPGCTSSP